MRERRDGLNVFNVFEAHARSRSAAQRDRAFIVFDGRETTYAQAYDIVLRYAAWLRSAHGIGRGDIVAMDLLNSDLFIWLWLALWSLGAKPAFINYNLAGRPLLHSVRSSLAGLVLVDPEVADHFTNELKEELGKEGKADDGSVQPPMAVQVMTPEIEAEAFKSEPYRAPNEDRAGQKRPDMAMLIYTSGTTGLPKPAVVSWAKCAAASIFVSNFLPLKAGDRMLTAMPLYHSSASIIGYLSALRRGCTTIIARRFHASTYIRIASETRATLIQYVGETCRYLLATPPSSHDTDHCIRLAFGNGMRPDVWTKFQDRFRIPAIVEFYGATEGPAVLFNWSGNSFTAGAVGHNGALSKALMGRRAALVKLDPDAPDMDTPARDPVTGFCKRIPPGSNVPGELLFRLDPADIKLNFQGYWGNAKATSKKVYRDVFAKGDAWFSSGDVLRMDGEGRWWFVDRIGDTFRWRSENVSTAEVSEVLGHDEDVLEANVYGVQVPGHEGRAGCAAVVFKGTTGGGDDAELGHPHLRAKLDTIARHALANLPKYAVPVFVRVTRDMAATGTNKQQKVALRNEGVDPEKVSRKEGKGDRLFWLKRDRYEPFGKREWEEIVVGRVKL
ncbi:putative long-chain fatty acid transporter [Lineolata rhizophorae]|uniref:Very long-chain fatty acid transport protein n=1 Tax=Lineolata rhizophorae TaxID=578093 RepID=A0A6A6NS35_9PEZI|nr:putative long-chain fatty acid transporter [Lineolata rhizophorae]